MMPACMSAETGVGASMVSGNQVWKGNWADFAKAAATTSIAIRPTSTEGPTEARMSRNCARSSVP